MVVLEGCTMRELKVMGGLGGDDLEAISERQVHIIGSYRELYSPRTLFLARESETKWMQATLAT